MVQGGLRILEKIERGGFDALRRRPDAAVAVDAPLLLWRALRDAAPGAARLRQAALA